MKEIGNNSKVMWLFMLAVVFVSFSSCEKDETDSTETEEVITYSYPLVASGQTSAFDADGAAVLGLTEGDDLYGQDAHYLKGATMSYIDNGDGTVTDNVTGLMWEQAPTGDYSWEEAQEYCENLELGGYDDWRLPTLKELFSISDFSSGWPYINTDYFYLTSDEISKDEQYWSSNLYTGVTVEGGENAAFGVNHVTGHIKAYAAGGAADGNADLEMLEGDELGDLPTDTISAPPGDVADVSSSNPMAKYVRAVRGDEYGINEYTDNGDATITDNATGLMWSQDDNGEGIVWVDALSYAENSELAGYDDWRLPNVKELQSIVDYSRSITATDAANVGPAIDPLFNCTSITSEAGYDDYAYYWTSTSAYFSTSSPGYYYAWYVALGRAVNDEGEDFHGAGAVRFDTKDVGGPAAEDAERYYNYVFIVRDAN
jgi:hypothetical protein